MLKWIVWNKTVFTFMCINKWLLFNWIVGINWIIWNRTVCMYKKWIALAYNGWCAIKPNQTKQVEWGCLKCNLDRKDSDHLSR